MARRIEQITRKRNKRREKQCILFNFEGNNKTEEIYFKNYQSREKPYYIKPINNHATDPLQMMEVLINYMQRKGIKISDNYKVYCVFDTDLNSDKQDRINQAIENCKKLEKEQLKDGKILGNCNCNPYTSVYKVVEYLINYI